ncbi:MAG: GNAT family N-acetyltransferase [Oscillospiraceae bacterium]|nr:GNAT family N-acetyltransferase [Oscillospiraceae bacterium]
MKIITDRLTVRPLSVKDRAAMQAVLIDFENSDMFMYDYKAPTDSNTISTLIPLWVKSSRYYTICLNCTGEIIGFLSMVGDELGFTMKSAHKRQGYGYEAAHALLSYLSRRRSMNRFTAQAALENTRSVKLLKKLGFTVQSTEYVQFRESMPSVECGNFLLEL